MRKNAFTLIELLAVIVLLAIIALIATPIVINIIKDVKKSAFIQTANGIVSAVEYYHANEVLNVGKTKEDIILTFPEDLDKLKFDGEKPKSGEVKIYKDGSIILAISNGNYCVRKFKGETELQISEKIDNCIIPVTIKELATTSEDLGITTVDNCAINGVCQAGTAFALKVNDEEVKKFYVISENEDEVTLIMSENTSSGAWDTYKFVSNGPLNALSLLNQDTNNWVNIPERKYVTIDESEKYSPITMKMRSKLLTKTEVEPFCEYGCPSYLGGYYWLATTKGGSYYAYKVNGTSIGTQFLTQQNGVRPVITLTKSIKDISLVNSLEVETSDVTTIINAPFNVKTTVYPNEANNKNLKWTSSDTNIVEVNADGTIIGKAKGTATITVETTDGSNIKKEINVTINESKKLSELAAIEEELGVTEINSCITTGTCEPGTALAIKVNDTQIYKFYVIKDDGANVTMITNKNIVTTSYWSRKGNTKGPIEALETLKSATDSWTNISVRPYTLKDDGKIHIYPPMTIYDARARLLTLDEATLLGCTSSSCPDYLIENPNNYWLSSTEQAVNWATVIGSTKVGDVYGYLKSAGIRPVITISK